MRRSGVGYWLLATSCGIGAAQMHVVKKPETVVRAVGVYEWIGELAKPTASRLIPVTIFIDGKLEDAGVYLARPIPMALQPGTVFELDKAGVPAGTVDLSFARHLQPADTTVAANYDDGWFGYGKVTPVVPPKPVVAAKKVRQSQTEVLTNGKADRPKLADKTGSDAGAGTATASAADPDRPTMKRRDDAAGSGSGSGSTTASTSTPATASTTASGTTPPADPDRPTMKRRDDAGAASTTASGSTPPEDPDRPVLKRKDDGTSGTGGTDSSGTTGSAGSTTESSGTSTADADRDPDRPTMRRRDSASNTSGSTDTTTASTGGASTPADDPDRPTLKKRTPSEQKAAQKERDQASVSGVGSLNDDPNRPVLHRGKPAGTMTEDDLPRLAGLPVDLQQMVAVSDAANRPEHPFARDWESTAEREQVLGKMRELARAKLAAYGGTAAASPATSTAAVSKTATPAVKAAAARAAARKAKQAAAAAPVPLTEETLKGYTLSYGGAPTYSYSAASPGTEAVRYVTVVAQAELTGELRVALDNVTDAKHLDRTPRLRLVDAVDAEASNRASLLFELRGQEARSFALYRVIGAQAEQMFTTGSTQ